MSTSDQRIPVLVAAAEKGRIVRSAKRAGLSVGEYMRRAVAGYRPSQDDAALEAMIGEMNKATAGAERAIDEALAFVAESNQRIAEMEAHYRVDAQAD